MTAKAEQDSGTEGFVLRSGEDGWMLVEGGADSMGKRGRLFLLWYRLQYHFISSFLLQTKAKWDLPRPRSLTPPQSQQGPGWWRPRRA